MLRESEPPDVASFRERRLSVAIPLRADLEVQS